MPIPDEGPGLPERTRVKRKSRSARTWLRGLTNLIRSDGPVTAHQTNNEALPWFVILALVAATAFGGMVVLVIQASADKASLQTQLQNQREDFAKEIAALDESNSLLIYYVMEEDAKLIARQFLKPEETWAAQALAREKAKRKSQQQQQQKQEKRL